MTLSPNRSYKNLPELRNATTATSIFSFYYLTRVVLPLCLLVSSILIYVVIYSMEDQALDSGSGTDLLSASVLWRESLKHQMANIKANGMLQARASDLDITDLQYIAEFKPFDLPSGINVWDLYYPQVSCPDVVRLGRYGEGGKWVCGMSMLGTPKLEQHAILSSHHLNRHNRKCVMYSFGISTDISFEVEILLTTNCVIHAFDPTVGSLPFQNLNHNLNSTVGQELRNRIHFHKIALNDRSGSTEYHTLNEHLYDIMLRLNHTFIDLLKVDVEGSEWDIFDQLFKHKIRVPVGELMIELHHKSMLQTNSFFVDAAAQGFIPFSREINLIPTFGGGDPFAVEYSFINYENLYHGAVYPEPKSPGTRLKDWPNSRPAVSGVIYYLTQRSRLDRMEKALQSLYEYVFVEYPHYPVVVFHDDLRPEDCKRLQSAVPHMRISFHEIKLTMPENLLKSGIVIPDRTPCSPDSSTVGYRHMCRFHATVVHSTLAAKGYGNVEYIMRLDDDSYFTSPIGYDLFHYMKVNNKLYGFPNTVRDDDLCVINLWNTSKAFLRNNDIHLANGTWFFDWWDPIVIYNNFEISHVSLWKNDLWKAYMRHIDNEGGIYTLRWGDAPLHTIGVSMMTTLDQVHSFTDIGYKHLPFIDQKPGGLPMPNIDPFNANKVRCTYYDKWSCGQIEHNSTSNSTNSPVKGNKEAAVLYSFGHSGREEVLAASINSYHTQFTKQFSYPFVIFYSEGSKFSSKKVKELVQESVRHSLSFIAVKLASLQKEIDTPCLESSPERRGASLFLRYKVGDVLRKMRYEWFLRFADDSSLLAPVKYDVFKSLKREGKKFGYVGTLPGTDKCFSSLFDHGAGLCNNAALTGAVGDTCSTAIKDWPKNALVLSNFVVSHYSVWESKLCNALFETLGENTEQRHQTSRSHKNAKVDPKVHSKEHQKLLSVLSEQGLMLNGSLGAQWGEVGPQTLCVVMSLPKDQVLQLHNVGSQFNVDWRSSYPQKTTPQVLLNQKTSGQRVGWSGGDVAASIPLPNEADFKLQADKLVWLFGDSFIGTSTAEKRVFEGTTAVKNAVAVSRVSDSPTTSSVVRDITDMRYYWGHNAEGQPTGIFELPDDVPEFSCAQASTPSKALIWPLAGIATAKRGGTSTDVRLLVSCVVVCTPQGAGNALDFELHSAVVVVVNNPYDPPDTWKYTYKALPSSKPTASDVEPVKWVSMAAVSGERFVWEDDLIYVSGSYAHQALSYQTLYRARASHLLALQFDGVEVVQTEMVKGTTWAKAWVPGGAGGVMATPGKIFAPARSEGSLYFNADKKEWHFLNKDVVSNVELCRTTDIAAPWKCTYIAQLQEDPRLLYYAGKAHPDLVKAGAADGSSMVVSYVSNSILGFSALFEKEFRSEYTPKFLLIEGI